MQRKRYLLHRTSTRSFRIWSNITSYYNVDDKCQFHTAANLSVEASLILGMKLYHCFIEER